MMKRRRFLSMMGATVATGVIQGCSSDDGAGGGSATGAIPAAPTHVKDVPVGFVGNAGNRILLGRDAGGLYAMTSVCTHNQCDLTVYGSLTGTGISCRCHGSGFSLTGDRVKGPAVASLVHFKVDVGADGTITIDSKTAVEAGVRTAVPG
jgi:nitrite reductase/ring-hydroxylating ferredoxin subunit